MITDNHAKGKIFWPENRRMTVAITFDFQGGEPVRPLTNGKMNNETMPKPNTERKPAFGGFLECWMKSKSKQLS